VVLGGSQTSSESEEAPRMETLAELLGAEVLNQSVLATKSAVAIAVLRIRYHMSDYHGLGMLSNSIDRYYRTWHKPIDMLSVLSLLRSPQCLGLSDQTRYLVSRAKGSKYTCSPAALAQSSLSPPAHL